MNLLERLRDRSYMDPSCTRAQAADEIERLTVYAGLVNKEACATLLRIAELSSPRATSIQRAIHTDAVGGIERLAALHAERPQMNCSRAAQLERTAGRRMSANEAEPRITAAVTHPSGDTSPRVDPPLPPTISETPANSSWMCPECDSPNVEPALTVGKPSMRCWHCGTTWLAPEFPAVGTKE